MGFFQTFVKNKGGKFKFLGKGAVPIFFSFFSFFEKQNGDAICVKNGQQGYPKIIRNPDKTNMPGVKT